MRKKLLALSGICLLLFLLICLVFGSYKNATDKELKGNSRNAAHNYEHVDSEYVQFELLEDGDNYFILYDKYTLVMYVCVYGQNSSNITPIYNADGSLKLYDK